MVELDSGGMTNAEQQNTDVISLREFGSAGGVFIVHR